MRLPVLPALVIAGFLLAFAGTAPAAPEGAVTYRIDPVHSSVNFAIGHLGVSIVHGRFDELEGKIVFDAEAPESASIEMTVRAASVNTGVKKRDDHLRSADFFDVEKWPAITFRSTGWKAVGEDRYRVTGELALHGTTRTVTADVRRTGAATVRGKPLIGFTATLTLNRSDYGMKTMLGPVADGVELVIAVEAGQAEAPADRPPETNRMQEGQAPTPYSAAEIRRGCPSGRKIVYRMERHRGAGGATLEEPVVVLQTFLFRDGDEEGVDFVQSHRAPDGPDGPEQSIRATWKQLQSHAAYPAARTTIESASVEVPAGTFDCWLYTVRAGDDPAAGVQKVWFAKDRPGPPVRRVQEKDGQLVFSMEMTEDTTK